MVDALLQEDAEGVMVSDAIPTPVLCRLYEPLREYWHVEVPFTGGLEVTVPPLMLPFPSN
jgi:hypothetical protein